MAWSAVLGVITTLKSFFGNGTGNTIGNVVTNTTTLVAAFGALAAFGLWFHDNRNEVFTRFDFSITYGQLGLGLLIFAVWIKLAHWTRAGSPKNRIGKQLTNSGENNSSS
jgi:hypothetical protein